MTSRNTTALVFAATMTLAGFLLFQVQLVLGKFILPWFGGSASTWLVCMLFFQVALLVGYAHAYAITLPLTIHRQAQLQIGILVLTLLLLPIAPSDSWKPADASDPTWRILGLLTVCVGLPYIALATTTPLLSRWLAHIAPDLNPVRFFAASNIGSFLGLLSYPFFFERLLPSVEQTRWWSWAYVLYAALFAACGVLTISRAPNSKVADASALRTGNDDPLLMWVLYSALGSALLIATTNAITQWSAVVPFLWVVPLSAYLLTFVIAFGYPRAYHRVLFGGAFLLLAGISLALPVPETSLYLFIALVLQTATLFAGCMICHAEMVKLQPEPARLPKFYLAIAAGGALGGIAVVLGAPLLFKDYFEHPLVLSAIAGDRAVAHVAPRRRIEDGPDRGGVCRRPHFPGWSLKEPRGRDRRQPAGRANPQFLRRRQDRAAVPGRPERVHAWPVSGRHRPGRTVPVPRAPHADHLRIRSAQRPRLRPRLPCQTPRRRAADAAAHRRYRTGSGHDRDARARGRHDPLLRAQSGGVRSRRAVISPS